jgi:hypothetical protein
VLGNGVASVDEIDTANNGGAVHLLIDAAGH